jgi:hypothetical protein
MMRVGGHEVFGSAVGGLSGGANTGWSSRFRRNRKHHLSVG